MVLNKFLAPAVIAGWGYLMSVFSIQVANGGDTLNSLEQLLSLGVGGVVAAIVLWWKRQDDKEHKEEMLRIQKQNEQALKEIIGRIQEREDLMIKAIENSTRAISEITSRREIDDYLQRIYERLDIINSGSGSDVLPPRSSKQ